jgi:hydroxymethylbilane synthase
LQKLQDNPWNGAIFAAAGLERIQLTPKNHIVLDWMLPAPAQGAMVVVAMEGDAYSREAVSALNHSASEICTQVEREFLQTLEGGCTAPIGALAEISGNEITLRGCLHALDGQKKIEVEKRILTAGAQGFGALCAQEVLRNGGKELMEEIKNGVA